MRPFLKEYVLLDYFPLQYWFLPSHCFYQELFFFKLLFEIEIHIECGLVLTNIFLFLLTLNF